MKKLLAGLLIAGLGLMSAVTAQDGLYGSFIVGQKFVNNMAEFNTTVKNNLRMTVNSNGDTLDLQRNFVPNFWTFGGTGYLLVAKHLMIGGKAWAFTSGEIPVAGSEDTSDATPTRKLSLSGGIGMGTIGFNLLPPNKFGLHLYPQLGLGIAPFVFHSKTIYEEDIPGSDSANFENVARTGSDGQATISKGSFVIDVCGALDWHPFKVIFPLFPSVAIRPLVHIEAGYSYIPGNTEWFREVDPLDSWKPDIKADGFYVTAGIGLGLTTDTEE
jgi:hypothetical protein